MLPFPFHFIQDRNISKFNCKKYLLESDNSPVIQSAIANIITIWGDAYCDSKFDVNFVYLSYFKHILLQKIKPHQFHPKAFIR